MAQKTQPDINQDIDRILTSVSDPYQKKVFRRYLELLGKTDFGQNIIREFPDGVPLKILADGLDQPDAYQKFRGRKAQELTEQGKAAVKERIVSGAVAYYNRMEKSITLTAPYSELEGVILLGHEMRHAIQSHKNIGRNSSFFASGYDSFAIDKAKELDTFVQDSEIGAQLAKILNVSQEDMKSSNTGFGEANLKVRPYLQTYEKLKLEHPDASEEELAKMTRTFIAKTLWNGNIDTDISQLNASAGTWNSGYNKQAMNHSRLSTGFIGIVLAPVRWIASFFSKSPEQCSKELVQDMNIDVDSSFFTRQPDNLEFDNIGQKVTQRLKGKEYDREIAFQLDSKLIRPKTIAKPNLSGTLGDHSEKRITKESNTQNPTAQAQHTL